MNEDSDYLVAKMIQKHPNVKIEFSENDRVIYDANKKPDTFPTLFHSYFSEIEKMISGGWVKDITEYMNEYGYAQAMNPQLLDLVSRNGRIYAIPYEAYALGLTINVKLFEAAGMVNADGSLVLPSTYEELAQTAADIRERTGKAGLIFPVSDRFGGWLFMPIAWSYGVEFMREDENGRLYASFDTPECVAALQYMKDLKWKYNAVLEQKDYDAMRQAFAGHEAAMMICEPRQRPLMQIYKMDRNLLASARLPAGPAGRYTLLGGNLYAISANANDLETRAAFEWLEVVGFSPMVTDEVINTWERSSAKEALNGMIVTEDDFFKIWVNKETLNAQKNVRKKYQNVDMKRFEDYTSFEDVMIRQEYAIYCQELYSVLDSGIQGVFQDKNADVKQIIHEMSETFQREYLDRIK